MKRFVLLVCLANISLGLQAGELYRWVDPSGNVHYSDEVPSGATQVETKKLSDAAAPNENLPYETRLARQNFPVTLYVAASSVIRRATCWTNAAFHLARNPCAPKQNLRNSKSLPGSTAYPHCR